MTETDAKNVPVVKTDSIEKKYAGGPPNWDEVDKLTNDHNDRMMSIEQNDFDTFKQFCDIYVTKEDLIEHGTFAILCNYGELKKLKYLKEKYNPTKEEIDIPSPPMEEYNRLCLRYLGERGNLEGMKWLVDEFKFTREDIMSNDNMPFRHAVNRGRFDCAEYLVKKTNPSLKECLYYAPSIFEYNSDALAWIGKQFGLTEQQQMYFGRGFLQTKLDDKETYFGDKKAICVGV